MTNSFEGGNSYARKNGRVRNHGVDTAPGSYEVAGMAPRSVPERKIADRVSLKGLLANKILTSLPGEDFARLLPHLEPVSLLSGRDLCKPGESIRFIYFPENAVISHLYVLSDGDMVEAAMIGREGVVGLSAIFSPYPPSHWTQVAVAGNALRIKAEVLKQEFARGGALQRLLLGCAGARIEQISQRVVCNSRHKVGERLCGWLMMIHDRVGDDQLPLTHEQIARHLGARRAGVTSVTIALRNKQIINYSRGHIRILDRQGLEAAACECYRILRKSFD